MDAVSKREYMLENLDCPGCAAKIERELNLLEGVKSTSINFVTKRMILEAENPHKFDLVYEAAAKIVNKYEPDVKIIDIDNSKPEAKGKTRNIINVDSKMEFIKLGIAFLLFIAAMLMKNIHYISVALFTASYILVGGEVLLKAIKNILKGQLFDENFLMALATVGAFIIGQYSEGVAVMLFYQLGELFQDLAVDKSRKSITELMDIKSDYANVIVNKETKRVTPEQVAIGELILIKPGERVPLDGIIVSGESTIDTSALTGEAKPRRVIKMDEILSGSINMNGAITIKVTRKYSESTASRILELTQNAVTRKAKAENFITKFARVYTPIVVFAALCLSILPPLLISGATVSEWVYRALIFLVVSCPCALVISIPLSFFGGIGAASKQGILIKGSNYLEALNRAGIFVFDKTGTLTKGVFDVTEINVRNNFRKEEILRFAAYTEAFSNHPIAKSIRAAYDKEIDESIISEVEEVAGKGMKAMIENHSVYVGNSKLIEGIDLSREKLSEYGSLIHVVIDGVYGGNILISDKLKPTTEKTIEELKALGVKRSIMLTGDSKASAKAISEKAGIDEFHSELLPQDKVAWIEKLEEEKSVGLSLVFIGDGMNDAPVLARADIGVAMGGIGSDAAIEAADIVIMNDDPYKLVNAISIAKRTRRIVLQNIIFALSVKFLVLVLGAFGMATMWEAVFADVGVALIAIINSMRIMRC